MAGLITAVICQCPVLTPMCTDLPTTGEMRCLTNLKAGGRGGLGVVRIHRLPRHFMTLNSFEGHSWHHQKKRIDEICPRQGHCECSCYYTHKGFFEAGVRLGGQPKAGPGDEVPRT